VNTKRERLKYLGSRLDVLSKQIQDAKREDEYLALVEDIAQGRIEAQAIDEDRWNLMLPKRAGNLPAAALPYNARGSICTHRGT